MPGTVLMRRRIRRVGSLRVVVSRASVGQWLNWDSMRTSAWVEAMMYKCNDLLVAEDELPPTYHTDIVASDDEHNPVEGDAN